MDTNTYGQPARKLLVAITDDGPLFSAAAVSLLTGVPEAEVAAEIADQSISTLEALPLAWTQAARRRASEAAAVTGTRDAATAMRFWAAQDHNVELIVETDGLYMPAELS